MIVFAVDDLMFTSKITTAAKQLGVSVVVERTAEAVLDRIHALRPRLVVFDLNSARVRPLETVASIKADPELAAVRTVGFVSHVQADLIAAARAAGMDEVLARSAFVAKLPQILKGQG